MQISLSNSINWGAVRGAVSYTWELVSADGSTVLATGEVSTPSATAEVVLNGRGAGSYQFRVRATGPVAVVGVFSRLLPLEYLPTETPTGFVIG